MADMDENPYQSPPGSPVLKHQSVRWRILIAIPAMLFGLFMLVLSAISASRLYWTGRLFAWSWTNQGLIALASIAYIFAGCAWLFAKWRLGALAAAVAVVLPFLRSM